MEIRNYRRLDFKAWQNDGDPEAETALALVGHNGWFDVALNCMRDGDMGTKGEDGIYSRAWYGDAVWDEEAKTLRAMTEAEVDLYLAHVELYEEWKECTTEIIVVRGRENYVLIAE